MTFSQSTPCGHIGGVQILHILSLCFGHVECMAEDNNVQKIKSWKPMSKRPIGRPKTRWENDVLEDIRNMNVRNWKKWHRIETAGKKPLSKPEPYIGCSALQEEEPLF